MRDTVGCHAQTALLVIPGILGTIPPRMAQRTRAASDSWRRAHLVDCTLVWERVFGLLNQPLDEPDLFDGILPRD